MIAAAQELAPPPAVLTAVTLRDFGVCLGCGSEDGCTIMPRSDRSLDTAAGWVTLCGTPEKPGTCAWKAEMRSEESRFRGYVLTDGQDPASVPVMVFSAGESGFTMWLARSGRVDHDEPEGSVA